MAAAVADRLDGVISVKTFAIAFAAFFILLVLTFLVAGWLGQGHVTTIEKTASITAEKTVAVQSSDLNQLDITTPPPVSPQAQPLRIEDAVSGLTEKSVSGLVPVIREKDGLSPFKAYAAKFTPLPDAKAFISFVMVDYGLSQKTSALGLSQLPQGVSFVLDAHARDAQKWTGDARKFNHEIWLSVPLQTSDYPKSDPGPNTILASLSPDEGNKRLLQTLGLATGYVGIVADNAQAYLNAKDLLQKTLSAAANRGLGIVQSDPKDTVTGPLAAQTKAPYAQNDLWLDIGSSQNMAARFIDIEATAVKHKKLVVFFRAYPATVKAIADWSKDAEKRGIQLAPLSAVISK